MISEDTDPTGQTVDRLGLSGVGEYWIVDPEKEQVEQFLLANKLYESHGTYANGLIRSKVVTGFEIPVRAIFDAQLNLTALTRILAP